jgi:Carboxypeptidase regulatory-like domain
MRPRFLRLAFSSKPFALLLLPLLGAGQVFSQIQQSLAMPGAKYSLNGTVVNSVTGEPIRRVLVQIYMGPEQASLTDDNGHFEFHGLLGGQTSVAVRKPGFFSEGEAARKGPIPVAVTVGPETDPIVLKLIPEAAIQGKIQSEDGEPIEAAPVMVFALHIDNGHKSWGEAGSARTDEYGEFRIANLTPGTYYLEAGPKLRSSFPNARSATRQLGFAAAYYAGTPARESATAIELGPGQQFEAGLLLKPEPLFHITGAISGLSDSQGTSVRVVNQYGEAVRVPVRLDQETGEFQANVPAGSYLLRATTWSEQGRSSSAEAPLVVDSDLDRLQIALSPPHSIPVMVKLEPVHRHERSELQAVRLVSVGFRASDPARAAPEYSSNVEKTQKRLALVIHDLAAGKYSVEIQPPADWYVRQAHCGETDLLSDELTVLPGVETPPIEIVLRDDGATIKGKVNTAEGQKRATVVMVSTRAAEKTKMVWTSPRGDFAQSGLAPGEYDVIALDRGDAIEYANPEVMSKYLTRGTHITLQADESRSISLDLVRVEK